MIKDKYLNNPKYHGYTLATITFPEYPDCEIDVCFFDTAGTGFLAFLNMRDLDAMHECICDMIDKGSRPIPGRRLSNTEAELIHEAFLREPQPLIKGTLARLRRPGFKSDEVRIEPRQGPTA
jgi:hypothetical protein